MRKTATAPRLVPLVTAAVFINYIDRGKSGHGVAAAQSTGGASLALIPAARAFAARWLLQRNENPALLQPIGKTYGQSAFDAIHGNAAAFQRIYGSTAPAALIASEGSRDTKKYQ